MTRLQVRVAGSWSPVAASKRVRPSAAIACCFMPCACSPLAKGRSRATILHHATSTITTIVWGFAVLTSLHKSQDAGNRTSRKGFLPQHTHTHGRGYCTWRCTIFHLRGPFCEPVLPVCAVMWGVEVLPAAPTETSGETPGGGLWPVQSAQLAAASCPRRLSASSELLASSALSCPAASSRAYAIIYQLEEA